MIKKIEKILLRVITTELKIKSILTLSEWKREDIKSNNGGSW